MDSSVGGNIGIPVILKAADAKKDSWLIVETSNFQAESIDEFHPRVSAFCQVNRKQCPNTLPIDKHIDLVRKYIPCFPVSIRWHWSLVLNRCFTSLVRPILAANSLTRSNPPSEKRSPPLKFILICLLLSSEMVFTIVIKDFLSRFDFWLWYLNLTKNEVLFLFTFQVKAIKLVTTVTMRLSAAITASR